MIKATLMACGEGVILDSVTNMISIFNIFNEIRSEGFPAFHAKMQVVTFLERKKGDPEKPQAVLKLTINKKKLFEQNIPVNFENKLRTRLIATIGGLAIPEPGVLKIFLLIDNKTVSNYEIAVIKRGETTMETKQA